MIPQYLSLAGALNGQGCASVSTLSHAFCSGGVGNNAFETGQSREYKAQAP
jgi:hypothetical protein